MDVPDATLQIATVGLGDILESTVPNVVPEKLSGKKIQTYGNKDITFSVNHSDRRLCNVPHTQARALLGEVTKRNLYEEVGKEMVVGQPINLLDMGAEFYNAFAHIGSGQAVCAEKTVDGITSSVDVHGTKECILNCPLNTSFVASALAWKSDAATPDKTSSVLVSVPLKTREKALLELIAQETMPVHVMSKEELTYAMTEMGHFVNVGFQLGKFSGMDYTGSQLDSEGKIALLFMVRMTKDGAAKEEYFQSETGGKAVVQAKLQKALPDAKLRVNEIETGLFTVQVVVDVEKK
jgi:hypothetical protein